MSRAAVAVIAGAVLGACHPRPPEPLAKPDHELTQRERDVIAAAMTPISRESGPVPDSSKGHWRIKFRGEPTWDYSAFLPDPTHELRWPLPPSRHPEVEPQFPIAKTFADAGIGWIELCRRGAQNRHLGPEKRDHLAYLRGWCHAGNQDADGALSQMAPLLRSTSLGIPAAVRGDVPNILVEHGDADHAARLLAKHNITDIEVFDRLAATYVELGKLDDAYVINEIAIARDDRSNAASRCRRLTRRYVLRAPPSRLKTPDILRTRLIDVTDGTDATCGRLDREIECWLEPASQCRGYFADQKIDVRYADLIAAHHLWPDDLNQPVTDWLTVADAAIAAGDVGDALEVAVSALENKLGSTECAFRARLEGVWMRAKGLQARKPPPAYDERLRRLVDDVTKHCIPD
ncbi:MAG: hypothetical protein JWP01_2344 [Myxococcales bacterium]|nr:hypothetical protein [Myxococcales bacterium]